MLGVSAVLVVVAVAAHEAHDPAERPVSAPSAPSLELPSGASSNSASPPEPLPDRGCAIADRGNGSYVEGGPVPVGKLWVRKGAVGPLGEYTLLLHLHGGDAVRKLVLADDPNLELLVVDRGVGSSAYEGTFPTRRSLDDLVAEVDASVSRIAERPARARALVVSSWSAGYRGVEELLGVAGDDPLLSGVILLDSLHASYPTGKTSLEHGQLERFVAAARRATRDPSFFLHLTHTEIRPPGYASTTETASLLLAELGVESKRVSEGGDDLLPLRRVAESGRFTVRGYAGDDARAHCDELRLLPSIVATHIAR